MVTGRLLLEPKAVLATFSAFSSSLAIDDLSSLSAALSRGQAVVPIALLHTGHHLLQSPQICTFIFSPTLTENTLQLDP